MVFGPLVGQKKEFEDVTIGHGELDVHFSQFYGLNGADESIMKIIVTSRKNVQFEDFQ